METELDEERKQRLAAAGTRKKLEADLRMSAQQVDIVTKAKDDVAKQLKRAQVCVALVVRFIVFLSLSMVEILFVFDVFLSVCACICLTGNATSSKTVKATDFKVDMHVPRDRLHVTS